MRAARAGRLLATLAVAAAGLAARSALAHHSPALYDMQVEQTLVGTVTEYDWGNPHVYLAVREVPGDRVWVVEAFASTPAERPATSLYGTWLSLVGPAFFNLIPPAVMQATTPKGTAALMAFRDAEGPGPECGRPRLST